MARWAADSLERTYGLPKSRIHTVLAGANLPFDKIDARLTKRSVPARFDQSRPLRIGFTGKDWQRKGLPRLIGAAEVLERMGLHAEIIAIGPLPPMYRGHRNVRSTGFIDKAREMDRFIEALLSCDIGCAPSYEEPMGIAPLEYLRLGIPVVCTAVGGLVDILEAAGSAALSIPRDATAEDLAQRLEPLARNPATLHTMSESAWRRKEHFSWDRTVAELEEVWKKAEVLTSGN
jgi:glycosyltransferase involved in cell wall biosynthesis